jgi:hypothetical protein
VLRELVSADDTALAAFSYSDWPSTGTFDFRGEFPDAKAAKVMFFGSDAANEDFKYILYGRYKANGPIVTLLAGAVVLGTRPCAKHPISDAALTNHKWADQISVATGLMDEKDVIQNNGDNNEAAAITFPMEGVVDLFLELDLDGGSVTAAKAGAIITGIYEV